MQDVLARLSGKLFIAGQFVEGQGARLQVRNPARNTPIGDIAVATSPEIDSAVAAAELAWRPWSRQPARARADALHRLGSLILDDASAMAQVMTVEQGKPLSEALGEIKKLAEACHFYAEEALRVHGEIIPNDQPGYQSLVMREAIGVVAAITPWNYPAELVGWKLCAGVAAGCAVIVKPSEFTPFTALYIAEKALQAGIPAGIVTVLTGDGASVGLALVQHPSVSKIAFTGSSQTGLRIQQSCPSIKRLSLELGGNCPMLVTRHADLAQAVRGAVRRSFRNMGQICIAINRIYVERAVYADFLEQFATATRALVIGDGLLHPQADVGSMAQLAPLQKTRVHLQDALEQGARLVAGGTAPDGEQFAQGFFFQPTIVADCTHAMLVMREETFGPLVGLAPFDTLDEAIALANDTPYGLAAYAYTQNLQEIHRCAAELDVGNVAINHVDAGIMNAPYGGRKQSGVGVEHGREGLLEYFQFKHVRLHHGVGV
ncbi:NAD-dependent succinate-semialdehyde dehydrogenase [Herbaspirillum sp. BH-1]|uniref:Succinate-semialdehyde dehydrogenase/glutarate-semialdehyde dehydrogenase n=1 Tax=Herbaspirillum frisingense TaxID=92645 RepID=A0ABU1P8W2_9BURK|nr:MULTISPECIES: NAD-dependent succinate-semialdehyde dehydrogenase [Herbaspirillum]MDR6582337.1 succinate-semialdehyde dehydrogenase/glutarate-semialdehyde dehydrogenase [Herbaspirillum frisingense]PLY59959.1 NAD-dependent succinate-semialdehyde dehydrogenase [Herbaspirillum sp. BH-1]